MPSPLNSCSLCDAGQFLIMLYAQRTTAADGRACLRGALLVSASHETIPELCLFCSSACYAVLWEQPRHEPMYERVC